MSRRYTCRMLNPCPPELVTAAVHDAVATMHAHWQQSQPVLMDHPLAKRWLESLFAVSPYMMETCVRYPELLSGLLLDGALEKSVDALAVVSPQQRVIELEESILVTLDSQAGEDISDRQLSALRIFRHTEMLRILWKDLSGAADLDETLADLSCLADACIRVAEQWAHQSQTTRYGEPRNADGSAQRLIVLGMGKLGGRELNVSSDIDLIYVYPDNGKTDGERVTDNSEFFRRVAQQLTRLLGSISGDGFVFRVDTRLRPFGDSGPLVTNFDALEHYYVTQGRDWERYAMIKARPITGDADSCEALMSLAEPFVYRRYLDYNAIDSLRDLKRKIAMSVRQRGLANNIKLGAGGIREIEFIGQAFQLVRGGREPLLRLRPIKQVLAMLAKLELMSTSDVDALCLAYDSLRRIENALQMMRDQQVHALPTDNVDQLRLITMLGVSDWRTFMAQLEVHQAVVKNCFDALFAEHHSDVSGADPESPSSALWLLLGAEEQTPEELDDALREFGFEPSDSLRETLLGLTSGAFYQRLTAQSSERIDRILPRLFDACCKHPFPADTLHRCCSLVRAVAGRSGYLQVLMDQPAALDRLVELFARSAWLAEFVTRNPMVIDELLIHGASTILGNKDELRADALVEAERLRPLDLEEQMNSMRQFQHARELRIAAAELTDDLPLMQVSDQLTWLAEAVVEAVLMLVGEPLKNRHGQPACRVDGQQRHPSVGVVAYGKLGGIELGHGSDLDLVFLHDSAGDEQHTDGAKSIHNTVFYARLAQKFVSFMTTLTPAGTLYEIDLRLRPNGQSGVLVTSLDSYANYQQDNAWTWEHQALVRARMVVGSDDLRQRFDLLRSGVMQLQRDTDELRHAVSDMRRRMRETLGSTASGMMDLKQDAGGIADIEFIVQYLVLANAEKHPSLAEFTDNIRILEAAEKCQLLSTDDAQLLTSSYLSLRTLMHRQSLQQQGNVVALDASLETLCSGVIDAWQRLLDPTNKLNPALNHETIEQ